MTQQLAEATGSWKVRCIVALVLLLAAFGTVIALDSDARADHQACRYKPQLPLSIRNEVPGAAGAAVWSAIEEWNSFRPGTFAPTSGPATVVVKTGARTWVDMPCGKTTSTFYVAGDVNTAYWAAHELGHTLGFADHIPMTSSAAGYINPGRCGPGSGSSYAGIMSYCTPRSGWWSAMDGHMYFRWLVARYSTIVPGVQ